MALRLNTLTCADKHNTVLLAISCLHLVNNDACEFAPPSYQQRLVSDRQDSLVHEGSWFDKLKGRVWEVQRLIYACFMSFIVNTLVKEQDRQMTVSLQKCCFKRIALVFELTAPGRGTGTSPLYITHFTKDVSTVTGVLYFPSANTLLMSDTRYTHTADRSDVSLKHMQKHESCAV